MGWSVTTPNFNTCFLKLTGHGVGGEDLLHLSHFEVCCGEGFGKCYVISDCTRNGRFKGLGKGTAKHECILHLYVMELSQASYE